MDTETNAHKRKLARSRARFFRTIQDNVQRARFILHDCVNAYNHSGPLRLPAPGRGDECGW